jgi:trans-aconitate methyltransferase
VATSRRVQWLREAARLDATGRQKSLEESGLTLLFAAAVLRWLNDRSENFERTQGFIARRLALADRLMVAWAKAIER